MGADFSHEELAIAGVEIDPGGLLPRSAAHYYTYMGSVTMFSATRLPACPAILSLATLPIALHPDVNFAFRILTAFRVSRVCVTVPFRLAQGGARGAVENHCSPILRRPTVQDKTRGVLVEPSKIACLVFFSVKNRHTSAPNFLCPAVRFTSGNSYHTPPNCARQGCQPAPPAGPPDRRAKPRLRWLVRLLRDAQVTVSRPVYRTNVDISSTTPNW